MMLPRQVTDRLRGGSAFSIADQFLVSGLNFLVGIVAARVLGVADFGLFTLILMVANLAAVASGHLLTLPMVTLAGTRPHRSSQYFAAIVRMGAAFSAVSGLAVAGIIASLMLVRGESPDPLLLLAAAFLAFGQDTQIIVRRVHFARRAYARALAQDLARIAILVLVVSLYLLAGARPSIFAVLCLIGASALLVALADVARAFAVEVRASLTRAIAGRHWPLSKWMLLMMVVSLGQEQLLWIIVGVELGDAALGGLRAGQYLLGTTHFLLLALENFMPRNAAEEMRREGTAGLRAYLMRQSVLYGGASAVLILAIAVFAEPLLRASFGDAFVAFADITRIFALVYMVIVVRTVWTYYLRTVERTRAVFWAFSTSSATAVALIWPAMAEFGIHGVAWTILAAQTVCLASILAAVAVHGAGARIVSLGNPASLLSSRGSAGK